MNIVENIYKWNGTLSKRSSTKYIILHNRAGNGSVESIHAQHVSQGWTGIGYHFYVRKDGTVYRGRPIDTVGAHTSNYNSVSIGVCFEGNFDNETTMCGEQIKSGQALVGYLKELYPSAEIKKHKDFNATSCPGKNFPFKEIKKGEISAKLELTTVNDIIWELEYRGIITNKNLWLTKCIIRSNSYWLAYKIANMTINLPKGKSHGLTTVNDIVWELNNRGIITEKELWLDLLAKDMNLYWLARKAANFTKNR